MRSEKINKKINNISASSGNINDLYNRLLHKHGHQGWWPINAKYYPADYSYPKTGAQRFEICVGAILTQNTSWNNASKALEDLRKSKLLSAKAIQDIDETTLAQTIRSAGYYNQKAKKLKIFAQSYISAKGKTPTRTQLLALWGIGKETADSILLYAYNQPTFVIDAYTRRFLVKEGILSSEKAAAMTYDQIQMFFEQSIPKKIEIYKEYHALIVEEMKPATMRRT